MLIRGGTNARYLRTGHLLYYRRGALLIAPFDLERLEVTGPSRTVHDGVQRDPLGQHSLFDVSRSGTLVYVAADASLGSSTLVLVDRSGAETPLAIEPGSYSEPRFSPRGTRVAVTIGQARVGIYDLARGTTILLGAGGPAQRRPIWMPDGERVVVASVLGGGLEGLSLQSADGTGQSQLVVQGAQPLSVTSDGRDLIYRTVVESQGLKVFVAPLDGHSPPKPLRLGESVMETGAALSPNGRYLAYTVDESGGSHVHVRPFPDTESGRWLVGSGIGPVWGPDSRELFFSDVTGHALFRVSVLADTRDPFRRPERALDAAAYTLVETRNAYEGGLANFDVSPDGQRFLMVKPARGAGRGAPDEIVLVQNWLDELQRTPR